MDERDELLSPSLGGYATPARRPWRPGSIFYVAFFGGILPAAVLALIDSGRLQMPRERRLAMLGVSVAGVVATLVVPLALEMTPSDNFRLATRIVGVVGFGVLYWLMRPAERVYATFGPDEDEAWESLWGPGLAATFGLGLLQALVVYAILSL